jgi:D-lactate dehydrogenase (cytochrome)
MDHNDDQLNSQQTGFPEPMLISDPSVAEHYLAEERNLFRSSPLAILAPRSTSEVADAVNICQARGLKIVTQGGNTGLCGGAVADKARREVILSTLRLPKKVEIDPVEQTGVFSASMTIAEAKAAAREWNLDLPISYGSEGTATIGGGLATNAGGMDAIRYGTTRDLVRGVEVVLPDGSLLDLMNGLQKDNTGYDLRSLFIGSEGTLGIITRARVQLVPFISHRSTALIPVDSITEALTVLSACRDKLGHGLLRLECMSRSALDLTLRYFPDIASPVEHPSEWLLFIEAGLPDRDMSGDLLELLEELFGQGLAIDGAISQSSAQSAEMWRIREMIIEAQKRDGASIKHDVSVPVAKLPAFLEAASKVVDTIVPGARPVPFGHLGDGNIHYNVQKPHEYQDEAFLATWDKMADRVHALAVEYGGSFSAEHGIGQLKLHDMERFKSAVALGVMRQIKQALDPHNLLNPGKVLPELADPESGTRMSERQSPTV